MTMSANRTSPQKSLVLVPEERDNSYEVRRMNSRGKGFILGVDISNMSLEPLGSGRWVTGSNQTLLLP